MVMFLLISLPTGNLLANGRNAILKQPWAILEKHQGKILQLSSDQEALKFHQTFIPRLRPSQSLPTRQKSSGNRETSKSFSTEIQATITTFWAAIASIGHIERIRASREVPLNHQFVSENLPSEAQQTWLRSKPPLEKFNHLLSFRNQLPLGKKEQQLALPPDNEYWKFSSFHDQRVASSDSQTWTSLLKDFGMKGVEARLHEYWDQKDQQALPPIIDSQKQAYIQQYMASSLLPIFHTYLLNQALHAEAQGYTVAWDYWNRLQRWQEQEQANQAKTRLCGTWKWIIHNHQNHGDHKTTMTFAAPGNTTPPQVQPTTILIHGDTVYLKWTFPQGIQEDSLLLSNRDTRLEGTFTNSLGPHGSISGQRLSPCKN